MRAEVQVEAKPFWRRPDTVAWMFYDFGNSAFTTLVITFIFSAWFTQGIAEDPDRGTILWSHAINISSILVALTAPFLGAIADVSGRRRLFLTGMTALCIFPTVILFFPNRGDVALALWVFVIANFAFESAIVFYNSYLPDVSTEETIGRVSGGGQALGYAGGLLCLVIALGMIRSWIPDTDGLNVRSTNLLVAGWYAIFAIPLIISVPAQPQRRRTMDAIRGAGRQLLDTVIHLSRYRQAARLIVARLVYNDGLVTVFAFAAIYAAAVFGMTSADLIVMGISINLCAALGSWAFGFVDDRIGGKKTIAITLVGLIAVTAVGASTENRTVFWIAALLLGAMVGPNQAASRSLMGSFTPSSKRGEWFGFFSFSGRLASVAGPFLYGVMIATFGNQRAAMGSIIAFFAVGLIILMTIDEKEGRAAASAAEI